MKDYGIIYGSIQPQAIEMTPTSVFIATNITPYEEEIEGHNITGYKYNYVEYSKDEYLLQQTSNIAAL
jgi:hypothetical protein